MALPSTERAKASYIAWLTLANSQLHSLYTPMLLCANLTKQYLAGVRDP